MVICFVNYNFPEGSINYFITPLISIFLQQKEEELQIKSATFSLDEIDTYLAEQRKRKVIISYNKF